MPRAYHQTDPVVINSVKTKSSTDSVLEIATTNEKKLKEYNRILSPLKVVGKKLKIDEVQSLDPIEVVSKKAIQAWEKNKYNPILVEDVSMDIKGLSDLPGTLITFFAEDPQLRDDICKNWLQNKDRRATVRALIALYDGKEVHIREGVISGIIAEEPRGGNSFGFDDIFIPDGQKGKSLTFAEMSDKQKDSFSHRKRAIEDLKNNPVDVGHPIYMLPEPYAQELRRVDVKSLQDPKAKKFAFSLQALGKNNKTNKEFEASNYDEIATEENVYYKRFFHPDAKTSLGLLLTDIDRDRLNLQANGEPILWQMGPERRHLALAQRAEFFGENQNKEILDVLSKLEKDIVDFPARSNKQVRAVDYALGRLNTGAVSDTLALKELGYKKISAHKYMSRTANARTGLFNKIGKYPRSIFSIGSMPAVSGWRDVIVTQAIAHGAIFVHRNSIHAGYINRQIDLINDAKAVIRSLNLANSQEELVLRNIGAALGTGNIKEEMHNARMLYSKAGVKLFRIYTINSDPRVIEIAQALRKEFGNKIEIFVGQVADKEMCLRLIEDDIKADALFFGHGGGRQCTSAANGMAVTTLEEIYSVITDKRFNNTTILAEGAVGRSVGPLLILGLDGVSYSQQLTHGTIETGDLFFEHKNGRPAHPYHGSASAPTMIIEAANDEIHKKRVSASGRVRNVEGKAGYTFYEEKANSMCFFINNFRHYAARMLADLGVESIAELRTFLKEHDEELLRLVSTEAAHVASAYKL